MQTLSQPLCRGHLRGGFIFQTSNNPPHSFLQVSLRSPSQRRPASPSTATGRTRPMTTPTMPRRPTWRPLPSSTCPPAAGRNRRTSAPNPKTKSVSAAFFLLLFLFPVRADARWRMICGVSVLQFGLGLQITFERSRSCLRVGLGALGIFDAETGWNLRQHCNETIIPEKNPAAASFRSAGDPQDDSPLANLFI